MQIINGSFTKNELGKCRICFTEVLQNIAVFLKVVFWYCFFKLRHLL